MNHRIEGGGFSPTPINVERPYFAEHLLTPEIDSFLPVIALSIIDSSTTNNGLIVSSTKILVCVRNPDTHPTDQDVISLPTERVPVDFMQSTLNPYSARKIQEIGSDAFGNKVVAKWERKNVFDQRGVQPALYLATSLMGRKLGVADN